MNTLVRMSGLYSDEGWSDGAEVDLSRIPGTNSYCDAEADAEIVTALRESSLGGIHWIDTGDYHYLSEIFLRKADGPFSLALFDNHSDEQESAFGGDILSCGNWVSVLKKTNPFLRPSGPDVPVYVSIDLDVLSTDYARTNWNQGDMTLDGLVDAVVDIASRNRIIGMDICGGLTVAKGASAEDLSLNVRTRRCLLSAFLGFFG